MPRIHAVVFDLDDTLYPEADFRQSGLRVVAEAFGPGLGLSPEAAFARLRELSEAGAGRVFDRWLGELGADRSLAPGMVAAFRERAPDIRPFPGVAELLERLGRERRLALLGDGLLDVQRRKLE